MTSRERIVETLNHREPDMLAIDFGGMRSTGIHAVAYNRFVKYLGFELSPPRLYDVFQQLAEPQMEVMERLGGDVVQAHQMCPAFGISIADGWKRAVLPDGSPVMAPEGFDPECDADGNEYIWTNGIRWAMKPNGGLYFDQIAHPYEHCRREDDVDHIPIATWSEHELDFLENEIKTLHRTTDKAILVPFGGNVFEAGQLDFGYETFFVNLVAEPDLMHYYFNRITNVYMKNLESLLARVGRLVHAVQFGDDLGTQQAGQISVQTYRDMIKPYHARQYQYVRNHYPTAKVFLHSCGAVASYLSDLIDAGVEVLNPIQLSAAGMDPAALKRTYGNVLSFWGGGSNTPVTATKGTQSDIRRETQALIDIFAPGGGYVFTQVHNIQPNVPPENILAIYDTALEYRAKQRGSR